VLVSLAILLLPGSKDYESWAGSAPRQTHRFSTSTATGRLVTVRLPEIQIAKLPLV